MSTKQKNRIKIPLYQKCSDKSIKDLKLEYLATSKLAPLSYAYSYTMAHSFDTIVKKQLLIKNDSIGQATVKSILPNVNIIPFDSIIKYNFNDIMKNTSQIKRYPNNRGKYINNLLLKNDSRLQLIFEIRSYLKKENHFSNSVNLFIFDKAQSALMYYDAAYYHCDIRDSDQLSEVMSHLLKKVKLLN